MDSNPIVEVKSRKHKTVLREVDRRCVANPIQARTLLLAVRQIHAQLTAFFAAMYYAGLRPEDAVNLRKENLSLPAEVWNEKERRWDLPEDATRYHTLTLRSSMVHLPLNAACERSVDQGKLRHIYAKRG